jgi:LysR family glycine cleavage system transcriptional activator
LLGLLNSGRFTIWSSSIVHLQLEAAVSGLEIALASLPLIEKDIESGRLVCPIPPEWCAQDYLLISEHREEDDAVKAFRTWITKNNLG